MTSSKEMFAKQYMFIPSIMSQHNSTQVPKYALAGQESQTSKDRRDTRILSNSNFRTNDQSNLENMFSEKEKKMGGIVALS